MYDKSKYETNNTSISLQIYTKYNVIFINYILKDGVNIKDPDNFGKTLLHYIFVVTDFGWDVIKIYGVCYNNYKQSLWLFNNIFMDSKSFCRLVSELASTCVYLSFEYCRQMCIFYFILFMIFIENTTLQHGLASYAG